MRRLLAVGLLVVPLLAVPAPARAQGADAQGWWSEANRADVSGGGAPAPPGPPDVAADDLLLQGGDPFALLPAGTTGQAPMPSALAALRFVLPDEATVGRLVLPVAAGAQAAGVVAYATGDAWSPAQGGAYEQAPTADLRRSVAGVLSADGGSLVFEGVRALAEDGVLSLVLIPGPADRVVVHHPPMTALAVSVAAAVPPPVAAPATTAPVQARPVPLAVAPAPQLVGPPVAPPVLPVVAGVPSPQPAPVARPASAPAVARAAAAFTRADDARTRLLVGLEALLVLALFGLLGVGPLRRLAGLTGQPVVASGVRGVGRFRATRDGRVPRL